MSSNTDGPARTMPAKSQQLGACLRCSEQKLKCTRNDPAQSCIRCQKMDLECKNRTMKPMGRPPRKKRNLDSGYSNHGATISPATTLTDLNSTSTSESPPGFGDTNGFVNNFDFLSFLPTPNSWDDFLGFDGFASSGSTLFGSTPAGPALDILNDQTIVPIPKNLACSPTAELQITNSTPLADDPVTGDTLAVFLERLGKVNVALCQHPLHSRRKDLESDTVTDETPESAGAEKQNLLPAITLADVGFGRLLSLALQVKLVSKSLHVLGEQEKSDPDNSDRSTALMALSCYVRLETLCSRTATLLTQVRDGRRHLKDMHLLIPSLVVDGFAIPQAYCLQIDIALLLCKRIHDHVRRVIHVEGKASLAKTKSQVVPPLSVSNGAS